MADYNRKINLFINGREVNNDIASVRKEMRRLINEQSRMTIGSKEYNEQMKKIRTLKGIINEHNQQLQTTSKLWSNFKKVAAGFIAGFSLSRVISGLNNAIQASSRFEERLDNLQALTGLSGDKLKYLADAAKETSVKVTKEGVRIKQSAEEILDAYTKVGSQRPELLKNAEALAAVTEKAIVLSEAAKMDLAPAVEALTGSLNQFDLAATESDRIINAIAAGSQAGAADIPYLTQAIEKTGTSMKLMNIAFEEGIGIIEAVAPNFTEARLAGNSLDKVLLKMKENNIGYVNGVFDMDTAINELKERFNQGESAASIFGVEHAKMVEVLISKQSDIEKYTKAVTGTNKAFEQAAINTDNTAAKLKQAQNEIKLTAIALGEQLTPAFTKIIQGFSSLMNLFIKHESTVTSEQFAFNRLYGEILKTNEGTEERIIAVKKLNDAYPDYIANIDLNTASEAALREELKLTNEAYLNRYIIEQANDKINEANRKLGDKKIKLAEAELEASNKINKVAREKGYLDEIAGKSYIEQIDLLRKLTDNEYLLGDQRFYLKDATIEVEKAQTKLNEIVEESNQLIAMATMGLSEKNEVEEETKDTHELSITTQEQWNERLKHSAKATEQYRKELDALTFSLKDYLNQFDSADLNFSTFDNQEEDAEESPELKRAKAESKYMRELYQQTHEYKLELLKKQFDEGEIGEQEYLDKIKALNDEALQDKTAKQEQYFEAAQGLMWAVSDFYEASKQRELKAAGDNEAKKLKIEEKYAEKQKKIASTQALIQGALGIVKTGANLGYPAAIPFQVIQGIQTLAEIAVINAQQFAKGRYDVIGNDDNHLYKNVPYLSHLKTGLTTGPTLVGEQPEIVIDNATTNRLFRDYPVAIDMINAARVPQRAAGEYTAIAGNQPSGASNIDFKAELAANRQVMNLMVEYLKKTPVAIVPDRTSRDIRDRINEANAIENFE